MGVNEETTTSKLTLQLFQNIFKDTDPCVTIDEIEEARGSGKGDNYTAALYRIHLKGFCRNTTDGKKLKWEKSVICKRLPDNAMRREAYKSVELFRNEVEFYTTILPSLVTFQKSKTSDVFKAIPKIYFAKNDLLIMEDLLARHFQMPDRKKGLSVEEAEAALKEIAKLHAISLGYKSQHPKGFERLKSLITEGIFSATHEDWYKNYYKQLTKNAIDMVSEVLPKNSKYVESITAFAESSSFFPRMVNLINKESELSVICHGDCWTNNLLFRYDETGHVSETVLVDFQCIRYGSLALDISNLIYCCTTKKIRDLHLQSFLKSYSGELFKHLKFLGHLPESCSTEEKCYDAVKAELKAYGKFALGLAMDILPMSTCSSENAPDLYLGRSETTTGAPELNFPPNELCRQKMIEIVIDLVDSGML